MNNQRPHLLRIARRAMLERGLVPDFPPQALAEMAAIGRIGQADPGPLQDLRHLTWCSIDNEDSRDLDQLTVAREAPDGAITVLVAIADVDAFVGMHTALDGHARQNTTSVYTEAGTFPLLPERLSADLTSLNYAEDRRAIVVEMTINADGGLQGSDVYRARVQNRARLSYPAVAAWLDGSSPLPKEIGEVNGLAENLRLQDRAAARMRSFRHEHGALTLETVELRMEFDEDRLKEAAAVRRNRAQEIIENFMIGANGATTRFLASRNLPCLRRVVRRPRRWDRIVTIAREKGDELPAEPDAGALERFLTAQKAADPSGFPELSLAVIKLLGPGEYMVQAPGIRAPGHFGLAAREYSHATAPNRRYPDMVIQRLLKAAISEREPPYDASELERLAQHCTEKEHAAKKVERQVRKCAAAMLLEHRVGERFDAVVTGAAAKGTWVRLLHPLIEGRLASASTGLDVGHRVRVQLMRTDVEHGYIDFTQVE